ncbi:DUF3450 family protein [Verrucomicrobiales bacterium BCK34]|nr:DUF3450 family protein [Verrucomicrobiales bacterium BCK34]
MHPTFLHTIHLTVSGICLVAILVAGSLSASAQDRKKAAPEEIQTKLQEWVKTKQILGEEKAAWEEENATLSQLNEIRNRELEQLKEFTESARSRAAELDKQLSGFAEERESLKEWRRKLQSLVNGWEEQILTSKDLFPAPLRDKVEESLLRIEEADPERPLQQRTRDVLLISQAYLDFQNVFTIDSEVRQINGEARSVDVLYLGMSKAWFVDASGRYGGSGAPTPEGWQWTENNKLAPTIREAIEVQARRTPPVLVTLPLSQQAK